MISQPNLVLLDEGKNFLVRDGILIPDNQELLVILNQLRNILPEQRKRRIGDDDVRLFQEFNTFSASKVSIAFQGQYADFFRIGNVVAVLVALIQ